MRKIALAAVAALALPLAGPALAQQNSTNQTAPPQGQHQVQPNGQQMQSQNQGGGQAQEQLSQNEVKQLQQALDRQGFQAGRQDGKLGPETKDALRKFQNSKGLQATGEPDQQTLQALGINQGGETGTTGQGGANQNMQPSQSQPSQNQSGAQPGANGR